MQNKLFVNNALRAYGLSYDVHYVPAALFSLRSEQAYSLYSYAFPLLKREYTQH